MSDERNELRPYDEKAAQARRRAILSELAQSRIGDSLKTPAVSAQSPNTPSGEADTPTPTAPRRAPRPGRRRIWWMLPISLVVLLALGFAGLSLLRGTAQTQQPQKVAAPVDIALEANGLSCPRGAAWSPDGKDIAVVGYKDDCPNSFPNFYRYHTGVLQIYDVTTGALVSAIELDGAIQQKLGLPALPAAQSPRVIYYDTIAWAPDGRRVAVTFGAFNWVQNPCFNVGPAVTGIAVTDAFTPSSASGATHAFTVLVREPKENDFSAPVWDTQQGRALNGPPVIPALEYRWTAFGYLNATTPLTVGGQPAAQKTLTPTGDPNSLQSFTMWQPAQIEYALHYDTTDLGCNQLLVAAQSAPYTFQTDFSAWSPDGRYLAANAGFQALLRPDGAPAPDTKSLSDLGLTQTVSAPVRDKALQQALVELAQTPGGGGAGNALVAQVSWRPDGKQLAVYHVFNVTRVTGYDRILTLYDCVTGKSLGDFPPPNHTEPNQSDYQSSRLYWSPNGSRLLLMDAQTSTLRIWGAGLLPQ